MSKNSVSPLLCATAPEAEEYVELSGRPKPKLVATYYYADDAGYPVLRKRRFSVPPEGKGSAPGKKFRMHARRPGGNGIWQLPRAYPELQSLFHSLLYAPAGIRAKVLYLAEGEKDADAVIANGKLAVSHWQGAGSFRESQAARIAASLRPGARVVVCADLDEPGAYCALKRARLLADAGIPPDSIRLREPALGARGAYAPAHGADVFDHLAAGMRLRELRKPHMQAMREAADRYEEKLANDPDYYITLI